VTVETGFMSACIGDVDDGGGCKRDFTGILFAGIAEVSWAPELDDESENEDGERGPDCRFEESGKMAKSAVQTSLYSPGAENRNKLQS
jgi:hypothetical protein